ncbi:acyltransferase family protein [Shinella zoogloeoides]|uniref:acyltransferase family protein n=1 Tax=Shinella zoogloeoides TaxID=352475 RepID=UPI00273E1585|nr:acyltransferase [Shinella zoogloeoides]WLR94268.1 acyltransferase [Shinella zoogloeoides]
MALDLNPEHNDTSLILDLLRSLAAFAVLIGHATSFFGVALFLQPPAFPYIQNLAVIGFFVLSGFLIAFVLDRSQDKGVASFLIDRFARIYSSFFPAMLLIGIIGWGLQKAGRLEDPFTFANWLQHVLMLNAFGTTWCEIACVPSMQTASHLWSLAVEFHIYLFAGFLFFGLRQQSAVLILGAILVSWVPYIYLGIAFEIRPGNQISYMWLLGFVAYYLVSRVRIPPATAIAMVAIGLYLLRKSIEPEAEYNLPAYIWVAVAFAGICAFTQSTAFTADRRQLRSFIRYVADFSFSLYLVHHPIQEALFRLWPDSAWYGATAAILIPIPVAIAIAHIGERRHKQLATRLKSALSFRTGTV